MYKFKVSIRHNNPIYTCTYIYWRSFCWY